VSQGQLTNNEGTARRSATGRSRWRGRTVATFAMACLIGASWTTIGVQTAGATTTTTVAPKSTAVTSPAPSSAEAQVAGLTSQIAEQQNALDAADELYNQAAVRLSTTKAALQATSVSMATAKATLEKDRAQLRKDAIDSYVSGTSSSGLAQMFSAPSSGQQVSNLYAGIGAGQVAADVAKVNAGQRQLSATEAKLVAQQGAETVQLAAQGEARQQAAATASQSEATLAKVKGTLAAQVTQQAAAVASKAATAAKAATTPAAAQAAANQATQAAQVAATVGAGSTASVNATTAANQAAGTAATTSGSPTPGGIAIASGGNPQAAGIAAVHGAEKYLGIPYEWAGPIGNDPPSKGLDCSGLTMLAWAAAEVQLPHSAADQYADFPHVSMNSLEPGDLIFFDLGGAGIDHVVMYVGPTLDGHSTAYGANTIIQSAHTGTVVAFNPIWLQGLVGAARP
jgi:cell wall-associated NlpC family hydrolase